MAGLGLRSRLVAWWRLRGRFDLRQKRLVALVDEVPRGRRPVCARCPESCCTGPHLVSLRLADVARLIDAGLEAAIAPFDARARLPIYAEHESLLEIEGRETTRRFPILRKEGGRCVFLDPEGRCAIHAIRPAVCRAFPYQVDGERLRYSGACPSFEVGEHDPALHRAAVDAYNAKLEDLLLLEVQRGAIDALGIGAHLPRAEGFEAALERALSDDP